MALTLRLRRLSEAVVQLQLWESDRMLPCVRDTSQECCRVATLVPGLVNRLVNTHPAPAMLSMRAYISTMCVLILYVTCECSSPIRYESTNLWRHVSRRLCTPRHPKPCRPERGPGLPASTPKEARAGSGQPVDMYLKASGAPPCSVDVLFSTKWHLRQLDTSGPRWLVQFVAQMTIQSEHQSVAQPGLSPQSTTHAGTMR